MYWLFPPAGSAGESEGVSVGLFVFLKEKKLRTGGKQCNVLSDEIFISEADTALKAVLVFIQNNECEKGQ